MAKLTPEQLKQIRLNNLAKGRMGQGRPKGSKNKVTAKRVNDMIIKFLDQEENKRKPKEQIIKEELKLNINDELKINDELPVEQPKQKVKEVQPQKENKVEPEIKEQLSKPETELETEKKIKLFDFDF